MPLLKYECKWLIKAFNSYNFGDAKAQTIAILKLSRNLKIGEIRMKDITLFFKRNGEAIESEKRLRSGEDKSDHGFQTKDDGISGITSHTIGKAFGKNEESVWRAALLEWIIKQSMNKYDGFRPSS